MTIRTEQPDRLEVSKPDVVVISTAPELRELPRVAEPSELEADRDASTPMRLRRWIIGLVVLMVAAVAVAAFFVLRGGPGTVVADPQAVSPPKPAGPSTAIRINVTPPATVVAGQPASFTVNYEGHAGQFSGSVEEWGDGVGASSVVRGDCAAASLATRAMHGSYTVTHTWREPGTYTVALGAHAYSCDGSQLREVQDSRTLTVQVAKR